MRPFDTGISQAHAYRLTRLARLLRRHLERILETHDSGLSYAQFLVIMRLGESDGRIQGELVDPDLDDRANITRLVDGLASRSLVERRRDEEDRRRQRVFLTAQGRSTLAELRPTVLAVREELFGPVSDSDLAAVERVLDHLERALR